jgi:hypothetical protein
MSTPHCPEVNRRSLCGDEHEYTTAGPVNRRFDQSTVITARHKSLSVVWRKMADMFSPYNLNCGYKATNRSYVRSCLAPKFLVDCGPKGGAWWRTRDRALDLLPCEGNALPLSYAPGRHTVFPEGDRLARILVTRWPFASVCRNTDIPTRGRDQKQRSFSINRRGFSLAAAPLAFPLRSGSGP